QPRRQISRLGPVLDRAFEYWKNIDKEGGDKIKTAVGNGSA
ncbi:MAG: hypothetical protein QOG79_2092, partial [Mycobacterium sp.]|nr:hypothetical protein [Mycobacterium sp.]